MVNIPDQEYQSMLARLKEYDALIEQSVFGIGMAAGNQIVSANKALLKIFNYDDLEEFKRVPLIELVAPASRPAIAERMERIARGEKVPGEFEYEIICKGGARKTLRAYSSHLSLNGKIYSLTIFENISEQKQAEDRLKEQLKQSRELSDVTVGRELRMIELEKEVDLLLKQLGRPPKYTKTA